MRSTFKVLFYLKRNATKKNGLDKIRVGINQAYRKIADRDNYVTAEKVRNAYLGLGMNHETLLAVFR